MEQDYSAYMSTTDPAQAAVHYTAGRHKATRRQNKHDMLLTFINHATTPPRRRKTRTAPVKPSLFRAIAALFM